MWLQMLDHRSTPQSLLNSPATKVLAFLRVGLLDLGYEVDAAHDELGILVEVEAETGGLPGRVEPSTQIRSR